MDKRFLYGIGALVAGYAGIKMVNKESFAAENSGFNPVVLCKTCGYETTIMDWPRGKNKYTCNCEKMGDIVVICKSCNKETTYNSYKYGYCGCARSKNAESFEAKGGSPDKPFYATHHWDVPTTIMHPIHCGHYKMVVDGSDKWYLAGFYDTIEEMFTDIFNYHMNTQAEGMIDYLDTEIGQEAKRKYQAIKTIGDARKFAKKHFGFKLDFAPCFRKERDYDSKALNALPITVTPIYDAESFAAEASKLNLTVKELLLLIAVNKDWNSNDWDMIEEKMYGNFWHDEWDMKKMRGVISSLVKKGVISAMEDSVNNINITLIIVNNKFTTGVDDCEGSINWNMFECKKIPSYMDMYNHCFLGFVEWAGGLPNTMISGMMESSAYGAESFATENGHLSRCLSYKTCGGYADEGLSLCWPCQNLVADAKQSFSADTSKGNEILRQLGGRRFLMMVGGKNPIWDDKKSELSIKIGRNNLGANWFVVHLNPKDLYNLRFESRRMNRKTYDMSIKVKEQYNDVYADQLQDIFEKATGLYTHMAENETFNNPLKENTSMGAEGKLLEANNSPYYLKTVTFEKGYAFKKNKSRGFEGGHPDGGLNSSEIFIREGIFTSREDAMADLDKTMEVIDNLIVSHPYNFYNWVSYNGKQSLRMNEGNQKYVWTNHTINGYRFNDAIGSWYVEYKQVNKLQ